MKLNLKSILLGDVSRLRYVWRFSTSRIVHPESVAEHSYYVALYSMFIADWIVENYEYRVMGKYRDLKVDKGLLLTRALLHDLEESRSGDVPRNFKYSTPKLKEILGNASMIAFNQILRSVLPSPCKVVDDYQDAWVNAKDETIEGAVLEFADFLSCLSFLLQEGRNVGAVLPEGCLTLNEYHGTLSGPRFDPVRELVDEAGEIMRSGFNEITT